MTITAIIALIITLAPQYHIEPKVALAVAAIESGFNPSAVGQAGEIGLYQIMPNIAKRRGWSKAYLSNPRNNIKAGLTMLEEAKNYCPHRDDLNYLVCYNYGIGNAKKIRYPASFPYVKKVRKAIQKYKHHVDKEDST